MGEKFDVDAVTGTAALTVPLASSPGRSGFGPQLSLTYDSGAGNGPFGLGWSLGLPAITRKTDKGIPRYDDGNQSDVFVLSGAEDLVPVLDEEGERVRFERQVHGVRYQIYPYRPRVEGLFARIERWAPVETGICHWRTISRDNVTTLYGLDEGSRIADPADPRRVFSYLICRTFDDKGNVARYDYVDEDGAGVDRLQAHEANRSAADRAAQRYLKRIRYGNGRPYFPDWPSGGSESPLPADWRFEVVLDYGDHSPDRPTPRPDRPWSVRPDPFSSYRAGFERRTYRRCERVLVFHHFAEEAAVGEDCLVRSTDLLYSDERAPLDPRNPIYTFLRSVTQTGYRRHGRSYRDQSMPPLEFEYAEPRIDTEVITPPPESLANLPEGLAGFRYRLVDLDGEGLSGILTDLGGGWGYKRNLSQLDPTTLPDGSRTARVHFGALESVGRLPSERDVGAGAQLLDLAGDGRLDAAEFSTAVPGFFERTTDEGWEPFRRFSSLPLIDWSEPNLRFVDLTGDGHADVLITDEGLFRFYPSLGEAGFGEPDAVRTPGDEERGPKLVFADGTQTIFLADMSGDGLSDLVRIRNGGVCYWPNLGYGRFGTKVTMDGAPRFADEERFDPDRIRLADIDGSGTADILYVGEEGVLVCFNRSGNSWAAPHQLDVLPIADDLSSVQVSDLLGNGTACLVWSSSLPEHTRAPLRYVDLMGADKQRKPHLLISVRNNLGAETRLQYAPSTRFYLEDKANGRPWITRLPFPVHVVERVETYDHISNNRFTSRYTYHHGYFDGEEREFRGFGRVERLDTEELGALRAGGELPPGENADDSSFVPPTLVRTWLHTGAHVEGASISDQYESEYYREGDPSMGAAAPDAGGRRGMLLEDTVLPQTLRLTDASRVPWSLSDEETREACRSLRGAILREEIYALDGAEESDRPYSVSERSYTVELLQPRAGNRHAVFFTHPRESVDFHYERKLYGAAGREHADPRVTHAVTLEADAWGNVRRAVSIAYGRRVPDPDALLTPDDREKQERPLLTSIETRYTRPVLDSLDRYRSPLPAETSTYELVQVTPDASGSDGVDRPITALFGLDELKRKVEAAGDHELPYEDVGHAGATTAAPHRRLIERVRTLYRSDDLARLLPLGELESLALPGETYRLAFTPGLLKAVYRRGRQGLLPADPTSLLRSEGGYIRDEDAAGWWIPSGRVFYHPDRSARPSEELDVARRRFFLPHRFIDPFDNEHVVTYDGPHNLLPVEVRDPLGNTVRAEHDYRVLQARQIHDPNGNRSAVAFDCLGMVVATAAMGKPNEVLGDSLAEFDADPQRADTDLPALQAFVADPRERAGELLGETTTRIVYDLHRFMRCAEPPLAATLARETHAGEVAPPEGPRIQISFTYSDGFGRELQTKVQAEKGVAPRRRPDAPVVAGTPPRPTGDVRPGALLLEDGGLTHAHSTRRWVGKGRTVYDNKGNPVKRYEPFFSSTHLYEEEAELTDTGVGSVLFHDPVGRLRATLRPDHTYEKAVFDPWRQATWDGNDTVALDPRTDPDVAALTRGFFSSQPADWKTWHRERADGGHGETPEARRAGQDAAAKTLSHAATPSLAFFDSLGRVFLTVADNGTAGTFSTRRELDIEGNERVVRDARGIVVLTGEFDMLGNALRTRSPDAGERWVLNDVAGKPIRSWDSRGVARRMTYDGLRRPLELFVGDGRGERLAERTVYGEGRGAATNHRGRVLQVFDGAGVVTSEAFDFKGNLLRSTRRLLVDSDADIDWRTDPTLESEAFASATAFDALNRPRQAVAPHSDRPGTKLNVIRPGYNEAGLLERVDAWLEQASEPTALLELDTATHRVVTNVDYNARGQRTRIDHANGVSTTYDYDALTFRLAHLETRRAAEALQSLSYAYDPVGNITSVRDAAQDRVIHSQQCVTAGGEYLYDALYRLTAASGREHRGGDQQTEAGDGGRSDAAIPNDCQALQNYVETYRYDPVGNVMQVRHHRGRNLLKPGQVLWNRRYQYALDSDRLLATSLPGDPADLPDYAATPGYSARYEYDAHGDMTSMPHLSELTWDERNRLRGADLGGGGRASYSYDAPGQRVRKRVAKHPGLVEERLYLGGFELFRRRSGAEATLERETLHIMDGAQRVALIETRTGGTDPAPRQLVRYQHADHLGSAVLELDDRGRVISYEEYYPYGSTAYQASGSRTEAPKRYRYTGKERDEETGLYYHGARYYLPWLGRWSSCDPIGLAGGPNLYAHAAGNPIRFRDPTGLDREDVIKAINQANAYIRDVKDVGEALMAGKRVLESQMQVYNNALGRYKASGNRDMKALHELESARDVLETQQESLRALEQRARELHRAPTRGFPGEKELNEARQVGGLPPRTRGEQIAAEVDVELMEGINHGVPADLADEARRTIQRVEVADEILGEAVTMATEARKTVEAAVVSARGLTQIPPKPTGGGGRGGGGGGGGGGAGTGGAGTGASGGGRATGDAAAKELEKAGEKGLGKAAEKGGFKAGTKAVLKTGAKYVAKAAPVLGIGVAAYLVAEDVKEGRYGRAAVDAAEGVPIVGDVVLAGDLAVQGGSWLVRKWAEFVAETTVSTNRQLQQVGGQ